MKHTYVVYTSEGTLPKLSFGIKTFKSKDIFKARTRAIKWANNYISTQYALGLVDSPSCLTSDPEFNKSLRPLSVDVCLVDNDNEYIIYGADVEFSAFGLSDEADYYVRNKILGKSQLVSIYKTDANNPHELDDIIDILKVVPANIQIIKERLGLI